MAAGTAPGLDRKLFDYLRDGPVRHAHDRLIATGDTVATADSFLKLMPMLQGRALATFADVLTEVRKQDRLLKDLN